MAKEDILRIVYLQKAKAESDIVQTNNAQLGKNIVEAQQNVIFMKKGTVDE